MRDEPADITCEAIEGYLAEHWEIAAASVTYAPVGFGSYHWHVTARSGERWFVTADYLNPDGDWLAPTADGIFAALVAATATVRQLAARGCEFAIAPVPDRTGALVRQVLPRWVLHVYPHIDGESADFGDWRDATAHRQIAGIVGRLHAEPPPAALLPFDFALPARAELHTSLEELTRAWTTGPYAEPTRTLLADTSDGILTWLGRYDDLVHEIERDEQPWVITHGEPHPGNVMRTKDGRLHLIDWDTVRLAPRERDLATLLQSDVDVLTDYQETAGTVAPRPAALELFKRWWVLAEICGYVQVFRRPHGDSADTQLSWRSLEGYARQCAGEPS